MNEPTVVKELIKEVLTEIEAKRKKRKRIVNKSKFEKVKIKIR
jgi:hypothetical protein